MTRSVLNNLQKQFAHLDAVRFELTPQGLVKLRLSTPLAEAELYTHGAHLSHFHPRHTARPLLFMSGKSWLEPGKPIRGGVPVCLPWFGPKADNPAAPNHGYCRLGAWTLQQLQRRGDELDVILGFEQDDAGRQWFAHDFRAAMAFNIGASLTMTLSVTNTGSTPFTFTEALHTYLAVGDIRQVSVSGLAGARYVSKVENRTATQSPEPIRFSSETDRVYLETSSTCVAEDAAWNRQITVSKTGSQSTVVWNPWIAKAAAMPDFGDEEWPAMLCIETANVMDNAVRLEPGATHVMTQSLATT